MTENMGDSWWLGGRDSNPDYVVHRRVIEATPRLRASAADWVVLGRFRAALRPASRTETQTQAAALWPAARAARRAAARPPSRRARVAERTMGRARTPGAASRGRAPA